MTAVLPMHNPQNPKFHSIDAYMDRYPRNKESITGFPNSDGLLDCRNC